MTLDVKPSLTAMPPLANEAWSGTLEARIAALLQRGEPVVLVSIVASHGSTPRHVGTRALQTRRGLEGTVGGGILEAQAMQTALLCLKDGRSRRASFSLEASDPASDMVCGGSMEVFCEFLHPEQAAMFSTADVLLRKGKPGVWTVTHSGEQDSTLQENVTLVRHLYAETPPSLPGISASLETVQMLLKQTGGRPGLIAQAGTSVYVEPLSAPPLLLLCGGGHVSLEVARLAHLCGFVVDVADDRPEFANAARFPMARCCHVVPGFANLVAACGIGPGHYVAIMTRGHAFDREVLEQVLNSDARYVGMIGSKAKKEHVYAALRTGGVAEAALQAVCCPIGMAIKAETPQQIAVAVVAELLAAKGNVLKDFRPVD
ncbi:MAG: XdhC family protein [Desulfovibrio sp.]|nr:XdhC family protein [Desulfovibrio sp.]